MEKKQQEIITAKIQEIKEHCGLELKPIPNKFALRRGMIIFEVEMRTNFQNMELYQLDKLIQIGLISKRASSGLNKIQIMFKK